jgi:hypothetical protein
VSPLGKQAVGEATPDVAASTGDQDAHADHSRDPGTRFL